MLRTRAIGTGQEAPARVDALAEPRDDAAAHDLLDPAVLDVGDEQPGRVRAEVDRGDARHLRGTAPRSPATSACASAAAAAITASSASEACSCASRRRQPLGARGERDACVSAVAAVDVTSSSAAEVRVEAT